MRREAPCGSLPAALPPARPRPLPCPATCPAMPLPGPTWAPLALRDLCLPPSFLYPLPPDICSCQKGFRCHRQGLSAPLRHTLDMELQCLPWQARPGAHQPAPAPPGPTAHCGHSPRAWQCAEPFAGSIPLFRTGNNARKERMLSFPTCRRTTRSTRSVRNKNLVNFRKAASLL